MGEKRNGLFQLSFNASLKVDFQGSRDGCLGHCGRLHFTGGRAYVIGRWTIENDN